MNRIIRISVILAVLVGACAAKLIYNKSRIDTNSQPDTTTIAIPVTVEVAGMKTMDVAFNITGSFFANKELTILSEGQGRVIRVLADAGDVVKEGQLIAEIDDELIRSQLVLAEANLEKASGDLKKFESMAKSEAVSAQQLLDIRLASLNAQTNVVAMRKMLDNTKIRAPFNGTITKKHIEKGSLLMPGTPVADMVDVSRLRFMANLSEKEVTLVSRGDDIIIRADLYPDYQFIGRIKSISVKGDDSRRYATEIEVVNNSSKPLRAGMFGLALFKDNNNPEVLIISRKCIIGSIKEPQVYVVENGIALLKKLLIGKVSDTEVEVIQGLKAGEKVVLSGQINLENGKKVTVNN